MANRPRRPKASTSPSQPATGSTDAGSQDAIGSPDIAMDDASGDAPNSDIFAESASDMDAGDLRDVPTERSASPLPPPEDQPGIDEATIAQQANGEDARSENHARPRPGADEPSATEIFAAEEGLGAVTERSTRPHLGEFEDDETLPAAEPDASSPVGVTDAYRDTDSRSSEQASPPSSSSGFGSLLGAGIAGAVLALIGAALLALAGLVPGMGERTGAEQYASAGDVEAVSSELDTLRASVEQLQSAQAAGGTGTSYASATDLAAFSDRLAAAEQAVQGDGGAAQGEALQAAQAAQQSAGTSQQTADAAQAAADAAQASAGEIGTRLDGFEERFATLEESNRQAGIALSAAGLKAAIDRGGPFMPELESFAAATGGGEAVEGMRAFAAEGVPTQGQLVAEWAQVEADIRRAIVQPEQGAAVGDQILAGLSSLVTVRSTGDDAAEGGAAGAVLARMSAAIQSGDLEAWTSDWQTLEPAAQTASQAFADRVEARRQAASVVDEALADATGAVPGTEG